MYAVCVTWGKMKTDKSRHRFRRKSILVTAFLSSSQPFYNHLFHCKDTARTCRSGLYRKQADHLSACVKKLLYAHFSFSFFLNNVSAKVRTWPPCFEQTNRCDNVRYLHITLGENKDSKPRSQENSRLHPGRHMCDYFVFFSPRRTWASGFCE